MSAFPIHKTCLYGTTLRVRSDIKAKTPGNQLKLNYFLQCIGLDIVTDVRLSILKDRCYCSKQYEVGV